jgi:hypothetical protein
MSKSTELARGYLNGADELVIILNQPGLEPPTVVVVWPQKASIATVEGFPTLASKAATLFAAAATRLARLKAQRHLP